MSDFEVPHNEWDPETGELTGGELTREELGLPPADEAPADLPPLPPLDPPMDEVHQAEVDNAKTALAGAETEQGVAPVEPDVDGETPASEAALEEEIQAESESAEDPPHVATVVLPTDLKAEPLAPPPPKDLPQLRNGHEVLSEIQQCFYRQEAVARRLGWSRKEFSGYRDQDGTLHGGVELEYDETLHAVEREMWKEHKEGKTKWPSEQTRRAIAHERMDEKLILLYNALRGDIKNLEGYQKILDSQMEGLRSLLSWFKAEAAMAGSGVPQPDWSSAPATPGHMQ